MNLLIRPLRKTFSLIFDSALKKIRTDKDDHILYKIVDVYIEKDVEYYKLQCSYTKAVLRITIQEVIFDLDILYALHPTQGCFVGIEYAKTIKASIKNSKYQEKQGKELSTYPICRYGRYRLLYRDRRGFVGFECKDSGHQFLMDPRDIALSRELIEEFDAAEAFFIGVWAGLKFINPADAQQHHQRRKTSYLQLVKG